MRVVIPSVNYGDHLAVTLPAWARVCPPGSITVVTSSADEETQRIAREPGVRLLVTDAWTRHDTSWTPPHDWQRYWKERGWVDQAPVLNKALAMDEAFGFAGETTPAPAVGEPCLAIDADCYPVGSLPEARSLQSHVLYGCLRYDGSPDLQRGPEIRLRGRVLHSQHRRIPCVAGGYFQLFLYRCGLRFGSYPGADGYDYDFAIHKFKRGHALDSIHVLHFGETHLNWRGRVTPRLTSKASASP